MRFVYGVLPAAAVAACIHLYHWWTSTRIDRLMRDLGVDPAAGDYAVQLPFGLQRQVALSEMLWHVRLPLILVMLAVGLGIAAFARRQPRADGDRPPGGHGRRS